MPDPENYPLQGTQYNQAIEDITALPFNKSRPSRGVGVNREGAYFENTNAHMGTYIPAEAQTNGMTVFLRVKYISYLRAWKGCICVSRNNNVRLETTSDGFALYHGIPQAATMVKTYDNSWRANEFYNFVYTIEHDGAGGVIYTLYDDGELVAQATHTSFPTLDFMALNTKADGGYEADILPAPNTYVYRYAAWSRVLTEDEIKNLF